VPPPSPPWNCPICEARLEDVGFAQTSVIAVTILGAVLLAPRRHVEKWADLDEREQVALALALTAARQVAGDGPHDVRLCESTGHIHIAIRNTARSTGDAIPAAAATPHDRALIVGGHDPLLRHLVPHIDSARAVDAAIAFVMLSGARLLAPHFQSLLERGGRLRLVVGDYLGATEPEALRLLGDLEGACALHGFRTACAGFHPKAWRFEKSDGTGALLVGSANLSASALGAGVEWTLRLFGDAGAAPLVEADAAFEALLGRPEVDPLDDDWIDAYTARRRPMEPHRAGVPAEHVDPPPEPHAVQVEALNALSAVRARGGRAGLVVLATGLGKTWLAAFDAAPFGRVLFVAHREEILSQAMAAFRRVRPLARLGRFTGAEKDRAADVLFASVQTIGRFEHLESFPRDAFDYVVVDEFHHASALTYRRLIAHFEPAWLLGLTATPERMDGGDLLSLCGETLVYRCDLHEAISRGLLCPFHYFGVPDTVDYANIPWRSGRFDETELTAAVATRARAANALDQWRRRAGRRTLAFCVSVRHADHTAAHFRQAGLRVAAVHSGPGSAPRASSLEALGRGELDLVLAVDMFNEGVDVPEIDTVLMLRPTESPVIWLQQLGRGLRRAPGKEQLTIIDYIGNHRVFLGRVRTLLQLGEGERAVAEAIGDLRHRAPALPPGCAVTYDLEALEILARLVRPTGEMDEIAAFLPGFPRAARPAADGSRGIPRRLRPAQDRARWVVRAGEAHGRSGGRGDGGAERP